MHGLVGSPRRFIHAAPARRSKSARAPCKLGDTPRALPSSTMRIDLGPDRLLLHSRIANGNRAVERERPATGRARSRRSHSCAIDRPSPSNAKSGATACHRRRSTPATDTAPHCLSRAACVSASRSAAICGAVPLAADPAPSSVTTSPLAVAARGAARVMQLHEREQPVITPACSGIRPSTSRRTRRASPRRTDAL